MDELCVLRHQTRIESNAVTQKILLPTALGFSPTHCRPTQGEVQSFFWLNLWISLLPAGSNLRR